MCNGGTALWCEIKCGIIRLIRNWLNRDRFVLSIGHASMLQYALLHLTGYDLGIDDLKNFRQFHSALRHPEYGYTKGAEQLLVH